MNPRRTTAAFIAAITMVIAAAACGSDRVDSVVDVQMQEWAVKPAVASVKAGTIRFEATNNGTMVHELAVLSVSADGARRELAEVEDLGVGKTGSFTVKLKPGTYELVCLLVPGEAGSTVDHYQQGMHTPFTVE